MRAGQPRWQGREHKGSLSSWEPKDVPQLEGVAVRGVVKKGLLEEEWRQGRSWGKQGWCSWQRAKPGPAQWWTVQKGLERGVSFRDGLVVEGVRDEARQEGKGLAPCREQQKVLPH